MRYLLENIGVPTLRWVRYIRGTTASYLTLRGTLHERRELISQVVPVLRYCSAAYGVPIRNIGICISSIDLSTYCSVAGSLSVGVVFLSELLLKQLLFVSQNIILSDQTCNFSGQKGRKD